MASAKYPKPQILSKRTSESTKAFFHLSQRNRMLRPKCRTIFLRNLLLTPPRLRRPPPKTRITKSTIISPLQRQSLTLYLRPPAIPTTNSLGNLHQPHLYFLDRRQLLPRTRITNYTIIRPPKLLSLIFRPRPNTPRNHWLFLRSIPELGGPTTNWDIINRDRGNHYALAP